MSGAKEMMMKLRAIAAEHPDRVGAALYQEAQIEVTEMKRRTPVDTTENAPHPGNLRNGLHVEEPEREGRHVYVVTASSATAPYAIYVHENPDAIHPIGQWKFMESVINEARDYIGARLAKRLQLDKLK